MEFIDPRTKPKVQIQSRGELPHLYKEGCSYFLTFRLFDAVEINKPKPKDTKHLKPDEVYKIADPPLTLGSCALKNPAAAKKVQDAILHFNKDRYELWSWCIMPNHVHVVTAINGSYEPSDILHSWKSYTSNKIYRLLKQEGEFWERESFDHLIRNANDLERFIQYTEDNPVKANLSKTPEDWPYSSKGTGYTPK